MSRPQIKKLFWSIVFSYPNQQQWTISWSDCDMRQKVEFIQLEMTSSVFRPRRSSKALHKDPNLHQKKGHGHSFAVCWCSDPLRLFESQWNHYIWEVCSANQWDAPKTAVSAAGSGQQKGSNSSPWQHPTMCHTTNASKVERIGLWSFAYPPYSPDLSPTDDHIFKHLDSVFQGKHFHNQQEAENAFQEFTEFQTNLFLADKNVLIVMFLFWLIKKVWAWL